MCVVRMPLHMFPLNVTILGNLTARNQVRLVAAAITTILGKHVDYVFLGVQDHIANGNVYRLLMSLSSTIMALVVITTDAVTKRMVSYVVRIIFEVIKILCTVDC